MMKATRGTTSATRSAELPAHLQADCSACVGLCCVALPFDAIQGFGFDKPAHTPCQHLCDDFRCGIHDKLESKGFRGCVVFDCHGAGQRVSQQLFPGQDWSDSAETAQAMFGAFESLRSVHELLGWLHTAAQHVDDPRLPALSAELNALCEHASPGHTEVAQARQRTLALLSDPAIRPAFEALRRGR